jgi:hypothetical protein
MLIYVKIILKKFKKKNLIYVNFMLITVKIKKKCFLSDGQTHGQLKTIVRNLTKKNKKTFFLLRHLKFAR